MKESKSNMVEEEQVQCVILAGGKGRRLDGKGKYSQKLHKKTLLEHVYSRMLLQTNLVAVNFREKKNKTKSDYHIVVDKFKEDIGPLAGIHAAITYRNDNNIHSSVVTVPVDTPFIPLDLIVRFKKNFNPLKTDVVIACSGKRHHPTIAMWNTEVIQKLENCILNNIRKIDIFTNDLRKVYVKWNNERYDPFYNINNLNDLKTAESMIKNIIS